MRISAAVAEGLSDKKSFKYREVERSKSVILFHVGQKSDTEGDLI